MNGIKKCLILLSIINSSFGVTIYLQNGSFANGFLIGALPNVFESQPQYNVNLKDYESDNNQRWWLKN